MASAAPAMATTGTAVFNTGPHHVDDPKYLKPGKKLLNSDPCVVPGLPRRVMVITPTDSGSYPVVVFLHGWELANSWYHQLLAHVASHGFIVVAPHLYFISLGNDDSKDIDGTWLVAAWLRDREHGLSYVLDNVFQLRGKVKPNYEKLALAGHSRGGDTAFAMALGLRKPTMPVPPRFSAVVGVDPVAGLSVFGCHMQMEPKILHTHKPMRMEMSALVIGTGHGGAMAPAGLNHVQFYDQCCVTPPNNHKYHFVVRDFGHVCMLDDDLLFDLFGANDDARRTVGGLMVAFLRARLHKDATDLNAVIQTPGLAPAVLDHIQHQ